MKTISELPNYMEKYERKSYLTRQDIPSIKKELGEIVKKIEDFKNQTKVHNTHIICFNLIIITNKNIK